MPRDPTTPNPSPPERLAAALIGVIALVGVAGGCHANGGNERTAPAPIPANAGPNIGVTPSEGPPGSEVTVVGSGFPEERRLGVGAGPPGSEYELFAEAPSDARGRVRTTVRVPDWAEEGETLLFALSVPGSEVDALSEPFLVSARAGGPEKEPNRGESVEVTGTLTDEGVECQALRSEDGTLYTLTGAIEGFTVGDRVRVRGTASRMSFCMQGTTLQVLSIEAAAND